VIVMPHVQIVKQMLQLVLHVKLENTEVLVQLVMLNVLHVLQQVMPHVLHVQLVTSLIHLVL
jgi:hypothetical protein